MERSPTRSRYEREIPDRMERVRAGCRDMAGRVGRTSRHALRRGGRSFCVHFLRGGGQGKKGMALLFLCACGAARMGLAEADWERQSADRAGTEGVFYGTVSGEALCRAGPDGYIRYPAELSSVRYTSGETGEMRGAVYIYAPWNGKAEAFPPDTAVSAKGKLTSFRFYKNPGKMDLERVSGRKGQRARRDWRRFPRGARARCGRRSRRTWTDSVSRC